MQDDSKITLHEDMIRHDELLFVSIDIIHSGVQARLGMSRVAML